MKRQLSASVLVALVTSVSLVTGQTKITAPGNKYTPAQDVQLGREAAQEIQQKLPILRDDNIDNYVEDIGERLVRNIPQEFQHNEFRYTFDVVNLREINAFALPGGPMYAHRGMIEKAGSEAEIAGVLAHEISHVALRHGTAQATKAGKYQMGQIGSAILGAIIGGRTGEAVSTVGQFGFGAAFLKYSREYKSRRTCWERRSWRGPATTRGPWLPCSRRSRGRGVRAAPSGSATIQTLAIASSTSLRRHRR